MNLNPFKAIRLVHEKKTRPKSSLRDPDKMAGSEASLFCVELQRLNARIHRV